MRKIFEKDPNYYRLDLHTGNIIYFGHEIDVKEYEYNDLNAKDIIAKIDELVEAYNSIALTIANLAEVLPKLTLDMQLLQEKISGLSTEKPKEEDIP